MYCVWPTVMLSIPLTNVYIIKRLQVANALLLFISMIYGLLFTGPVHSNLRMAFDFTTSGTCKVTIQSFILNLLTKAGI